MDYVLNGQACGSVASALMATDFDTNSMRPYEGADGRTYVTVNTGKFTYVKNKYGKKVKKPVYKSMPLIANATSLRKDEWKYIDRAVIRAGKPKLRFVGDVRAAGNTLTLPNGMGTTVLEQENVGDITDASISMDGLREAENDRFTYGITNMPLPIIHKDFHYTLRQIRASRSRGTNLDTTHATLAARRVAEMAEKLALGTLGSYSFGGGSVYGALNHPSRNTKVLTLPTAVGWTPDVLIGEILAMRAQAVADFYEGPFILYFSSGWDAYLDSDYSATYGGVTLRERILKIGGISEIRTAYYMTDYQVMMIQMTEDVIRMVVGMDLTTVQWETHGGMRLNFKVMAIIVPQVRVDQGSNSGIVHGTAA